MLPTMRGWMRVAVALLLFASVAVVAENDRESAKAQGSAVFAPGDAAAYDMRLIGDWPLGGRTEGIASAGPRFEAQGAISWPDRGGALVQAIPIIWQAPVLSVDANGRAYWTEEAATWMSADAVMAARIDEQSRPLDRNDIQGDGRLVTRVTTYLDAPDCLVGGPALACQVSELGLVLKADGMAVQPANLHGVPTTLHQLTDGSNAVSWWMGELPVPLRMDVRTDAGMVRFDLTGFRPGDGTLNDWSQAAPTMTWARPSRWLVDDGALDHPFRLSLAYDMAMRTSSYPDLREWMQAHPAGYVFKADYHEEKDAEQFRHVWNVHLSDGAAGFSFAAVHTSQWSLQGVPDLLRPVQIKTTAAAGDPLAASAPELHDIPRLPTVASLWDRWGRYVPADQEPTAWGFLVQGGSNPVVQLIAGSVSEIAWQSAGADIASLTGGQRDESLLILDGSGQALRYLESHAGRGEATPAQPETFTVSAPRGYATILSFNAAPVSPAGWIAFSLGLAVIAWPFVKGAGISLFSRLRPDQLLEHPVRATLAEAVSAEPGLHFSQICKRVGEPAGRTRHHLRKLVEGRLITEETRPGFTCYFPKAGMSRTAVQAAPLTRGIGARNILHSLIAAPGLCAKDLSERAQLSPATTSYHLRRLEAIGVLASQRDGRQVRIFVTSEGHEAMESLGLFA